MRATWDVFCNVIDNYGDIGIAWRLARELARQPDLDVRLWVDDLEAFRRIWPSIDADRSEQLDAGVTVRAWRTPFDDTAAADVVIEAFGCALPESYLHAMSARASAPVWINLEYLTAESWADAHHGLPSPHPSLPLTKHFFFPGYTEATGGLLIEPDLAERRRAFLDDGVADFWRRLDVVSPRPDELRVSLFAYQNAALPALLDAWAGDPAPVSCIVPEGRVIPQLAAWLGVAGLRAGETHRRGALQVYVLPFLSQDDYDRLLWACAVNFVRGEDSCVHAQLAARPLVWQAYPQTEGAHAQKVEALLARYSEGLDAASAAAIGGLWRHWNGTPAAPELASCWRTFRVRHETMTRHADAWAARLSGQGRLTGKLLEFVEKRIK
ncbi:conserved hypothetical protein [Thiobacillus denitrificans ATCC 25259]|uniref:Protein-arginine rhamnosyltransferase n=1 Tax=Thiobacillus denitrificans (strain ATCC 25259 / T1) TaxID=292415 RepID=Q3SKH2_THIDA|nr:elongation factor P maturation arginine rhamnosyltransferase EarP [Thiobacillus denitrificans]AAZ96809.1 conserved hypothetical protein [Thiobacillus denitrificans ATCC 25259]